MPRTTTPTDKGLHDDLTVLADTLRGLCAVITKIARRDHERLLERHQAAIGAMEHGVLRRTAQGAETLAELSALMAASPSTLVYVIDRLVSKGLLTKRNDPRDRRRERLSLSPKGRRLLASIPTMDTESAIVRSLALMSERRRAALLRDLGAFVVDLSGAAEWTPEFHPVAAAGRMSAPKSVGPVARRRAPRSR